MEQLTLSDADIIAQMQENDDAGNETEEIVEVQDTEASTQKEPEVQIPEEVIEPITKQELNFILNQLGGIQVRFGKAVFKLNHINKGKHRFSAECVNEIVEGHVLPNVFDMNKKKVEDDSSTN